jgi:hypothetical protein
MYILAQKHYLIYAMVCIASCLSCLYFTEDNEMEDVSKFIYILGHYLTELHLALKENYIKSVMHPFKWMLMANLMASCDKTM